MSQDLRTSVKPDTRRWIYLVALAVGVASGLFIMASTKRYVDGFTQQMGGIMICAMPFLLGLMAGMFRPDHPIWTGLILTALALAGGLPLLGEGAVCLVVIAPVYIVVGMLVAGITGAIVRGRWRPPGTLAILLLLLPAAGTWAEPRLFRGPRPVVTIADSVVVDAPRAAVWATVSHLTLDIPERPLTGPAALLAAALPRPVALVGDGINPGDLRRVVFDNGTLLATVTRSEPLRRFEIDLRVERAGREFFDHWAQLMDSTFTFEDLPGGRTLITHATRYRPRVFPRWYFEPFERLFAKKVQGFLLEEFVRQRFIERSRGGQALAAR